MIHPQSPQDFLTLVVIGDNPSGLTSLQKILAEEGLRILLHADAEKSLSTIAHKCPSIVFLDFNLWKLRGLELLDRIITVAPEAAVFLLTDQDSSATGAKAIPQGARGYLIKPVAAVEPPRMIRQLVREFRARHRSDETERQRIETSSFQGIIGRSLRMLEVFARIRHIAPHFRTVLLTGETGTGKELVARALHDLSQARGGPFVALNCTAVVETLFESELFGYVKGAFTGAQQDKQGLLEYAHGGTLLLDEVGDMPFGLQSKLLRVLQNQEFQRVGSPVPRTIDIRVIAATNRDLRAMVGAGEFRKDLFYRLSMVEIRLPRLAERKEDLALLEQHFLHRFRDEFKKPVRGLTPRAQALLAAYCWPGNVRELENTLGHACMMSAGEMIDVEDLPPHLFEQCAVSEGKSEPILPLGEFERSYVQRVLVSMDGNKVRTAEALGISRSKLYSLLLEDGREKRR